MLGVVIQDSGKTAVVRSIGRIVVGETDALRNAVLAQANRRTVVLDLTSVDAIDGSGIGLLVFLQGWARAVGIELPLMNPTRNVRELLELIGFTCSKSSLRKTRSQVTRPPSHRRTKRLLINAIDRACAWR